MLDLFSIPALQADQLNSYLKAVIGQSNSSDQDLIAGKFAVEIESSNGKILQYRMAVSGELLSPSTFADVLYRCNKTVTRSANRLDVIFSFGLI